MYKFWFVWARFVLYTYELFNKPKSSKSCRASFENLGQKFVTNGQTDIISHYATLLSNINMLSKICIFGKWKPQTLLVQNSVDTSLISHTHNIYQVFMFWPLNSSFDKMFHTGLAHWTPQKWAELTKLTYLFTNQKTPHIVTGESLDMLLS